MKQFIRAFSIGLFTATLISFALYMFLTDENVQNIDYSIEELSEKVEEKGHRVITEEEYITLSLLGDEEERTATTENNEDDIVENKDDDNEVNDENEANEDEDNTVSYELEVTEGMLPGDVSKLLEENEIIESASELNNYLEDHDISTKIQIGSHELNNEMSISEIATELTNNE